ncbi:MAG: hypothetical protein KF901_22425 [Myxococcales bacterium]|nr:hypothetical protein [Myxococcales bacterium]
MAVPVESPPPPSPVAEAEVRVAIRRLAESVEVLVDGVEGRAVCLGARCRPADGRRALFELALPRRVAFVGETLLEPLKVDRVVVDPIVVGLDPGLVISALPGAPHDEALPTRRFSDLRRALWAPAASRRTLDAGALLVRLAAHDPETLDALEARVAELQSVLFARFGVRAARVAIALDPEAPEDVVGLDFALLRALATDAADQPALLEALAASVVRARPALVIDGEAGSTRATRTTTDASANAASATTAANAGAASASPDTEGAPTEDDAVTADAELPPIEPRPRWLARGFGRYGAWLLANDLRREGNAEGLRVIAAAFERHRAHPIGVALRDRDDPDGVALALFCADVTLRARGGTLVEALMPDGSVGAHPEVARALEARLAFGGVLPLDPCLRPLGLKLLARPTRRLTEGDRRQLLEGAALEGLRVTQGTARLREGDVLTHLDDHRVESASDVDLALRDLDTDARVIATLRRDGRPLRLPLRVPLRRGDAGVRFWIHALPGAPGPTFPFAPTAPR